jgi:hypothetical protein
LEAPTGSQTKPRKKRNKPNSPSSNGPKRSRSKKAGVDQPTAQLTAATIAAVPCPTFAPPAIPPNVDEDGNIVGGFTEQELEDADGEDDPLDNEDGDDDIAQPAPVAAAPAPAVEQNPWKRITIAELLATRNQTQQGKIDSSLPPGYTGSAKVIGDLGDADSPGEFLDKLFTDEIIDKFRIATNSYAARHRFYSWKPKNDVTNAELKKYWGLVLFMGIFQLPSREMYWNSDLYVGDFVKKTMTFHRFKAITKNLHFWDVSDISADEKQRRNKLDGYWSVSEFFDMLAANFQLYYQCGQCLNIDEMCIFFKGRHKCKCYNPNKPNKWHLKAFCLNDSQTGYLYNFFMYRGSDEQRPPGMAATLWPVHKLTESPALHGKHHLLTTDNWYTSLDTIQEVSKIPKRMHSCGTVKSNKKGLPKEGLFNSKGKDVKDRGYFECREQNTPEGPVYFTAWQDNKPVHVLSTWKPQFTSVNRVEKRPAGGGYARTSIPIPTVILAYNASMGGTDKFDQLGSYYDDRSRTLTWKHRVFTHFLRAACINTHILYKMKKGSDIPLLDFMTKVIEDWTNPKEPATVAQPQPHLYFDSDSEDLMDYPPCGQIIHRNTWAKRVIQRTTGVHRPIHVESKNGSDNRRRCKYCKDKCSSKCYDCGVFLCISNNVNNSCWCTFHSTNFN